MTSIFEPFITPEAQAKADADWDYLPDDLRKHVAEILTAMDAVKGRFMWPKDNSFEAAGAALTAFEAQRHRPLTNREIAQHHEDFHRAMAPWVKMLTDISCIYSRPMVLQMNKPANPPKD